LTLGSPTQGIAISPDGSRLYAALEGFGDVGLLVVWDLAANELIKSVDAYGGLFDVALTPSSSWLFVSVANLGKLYVVSTTDLDFTWMYEVGGGPRRLAMTADGGTVLVANLQGWVDVIR
jgi:DNA-binding beta-propeller fold protein YncE